jgi:hypothetical protein
MPEEMADFYSHRKISGYRVAAMRMRFKRKVASLAGLEKSNYLKAANDFYFTRQYETAKFHPWSPKSEDWDRIEGEIWDIEMQSKAKPNAGL